MLGTRARASRARHSLIYATLLGCGIVGVDGVSAASSHRSASTPPTAQGPLIERFSGATCDHHRLGERSSPKAGRRRLEGTAEVCSWFYTYAPVLELDPTRDYLVVWTQIEVDPKPGFCIVRVDSTWASPEASVVTVAPDATSAPAPIRLRVRAGGYGLGAARVEQSPGVTAGTLEAASDPSGAQFLWRGDSDRRVLFAIGAEFALDSQASLAWHVLRGEAYQLRRCT